MVNGEQARHADPAGRAFAAAVAAYQSWLRQFATAGANPHAAGQAAQALAASLTEQLAAWLRQAHPLAGGSLAAGPHGARVQQLLGEWTAAQSRLAAHWAQIAQTAGREFTVRIGGSTPLLDPSAVRRHYETWIECAESAYADIAASQRYCEDQAALINATVALTAEVRRHADTLAQAFDLPTRAELNALHRRVEELESPTQPTRVRKPATKRKPRRPDRRGRRKPA
jgi:hypothetical protein